MPVRGLLISAVALALLSGGVWWSERVEKEKEISPAGDAPKLVSLKEADIQGIELRRQASPSTVLRKDRNGNWQMSAPETYRVDSESANSVASAFAALTWDRLVEDKPVDLGTYGLQQPSLRVIATGKDNKPKELLIGDEAPTGGNFYAKLGGEPRVFTISGSNKTSFDKTTNDLRDKRLLTFDPEKLTRVELTSKGKVVAFGKNNSNEWQIVQPAPLRADGFAVEELIRKLKDARMEISTEDSAAKASAFFGSGTPAGSVATSDNAGTQTLQVRKSGTDYFVKSSAVEGVYKVSNEVGEALGKSLEDFRNKKVFDFGFNQPARVEIRAEGKTYAFSKSGDKWTSGGKAMDSVSVQALIDKLRDLSATKFRDSGFASPSIDVTVVSNDGKRTESVAIAKDATGQRLAKRGSEMSIYELDAKTVDELLRAAADVKETPPPTAKK